MSPPKHILETVIYVDDIDAAEVFYRDVLGLTQHGKVTGKFVFFELDQAMLLIFNPEASQGASHDLPPHGAQGDGHIALRVEEASLDGWAERLQNKGVAIESDYTWPNGARSLYFRDPAGNSVELAPWRIWQQ